MGMFLDPSDFPTIGGPEAATLIKDAEALAVLAAPCLADDLTGLKRDAAAAILRGTILRWYDAGTGVAVQTTAGPFSQTLTPQVRRNSFWPSEIKDLQRVCRDASSGKAYSVDTAPSFGDGHADICSLHFGANYCSCGANLTNGAGPLWEVNP